MLSKVTSSCVAGRNGGFFFLNLRNSPPKKKTLYDQLAARPAHFVGAQRVPPQLPVTHDGLGCLVPVPPVAVVRSTWSRVCGRVVPVPVPVLVVVVRGVGVHGMMMTTKPPPRGS